MSYSPDAFGGIYRDLAGSLSKLDARRTDYQWDIDRDLPWARIDEPGDFLPPDLVADLGFDAAALQAVPEAWEMFQWASALLICESFMVAEKQIVDFMEWQSGLLRHRSNRLLVDEEMKHIALFRRIGEHLRERRPEWTFDFDRHFLESHCETVALEMLRTGDDVRLAHLTFWPGVVYFEEVTVYMHVRLARAPSVQPFWQLAHEAHMREEVQHLLTDSAHVGAAAANEVEWQTSRRVLQRAIVGDFDRSFGPRIARRMVAESFPTIAFDLGVPPEATRVHDDIVQAHRAFRRTRKLLAGESLAAEPTPARAGSDLVVTGPVRTAAEIERWLVDAVARALEVHPSKVDPLGDLPSLAVESLKAVELSAELADWLGRPVSPSLLWAHRSIREIAVKHGAA